MNEDVGVGGGVSHADNLTVGHRIAAGEEAEAEIVVVGEAGRDKPVVATGERGEAGKLIDTAVGQRHRACLGHRRGCEPRIEHHERAGLRAAGEFELGFGKGSGAVAVAIDPAHLAGRLGSECIMSLEVVLDFAGFVPGEAVSGAEVAGETHVHRIGDNFLDNEAGKYHILAVGH